MCEQCLVNPLYFGEVLPGWFLIRARREGTEMKVGQWGLVECNGPTFVWTTTPKPDPTVGLTEKQEREFWASLTEEQKKAEIAREGDFDDALVCNPFTGYKLVKAAMKKGYRRNTHGHLSSWLFHYLGVWIRDHDPEVEDDPFPNNDNYYPHDYTLGKE